MERARGSNAVAVWILSVLLAALFLSTGIPKLLGSHTYGLQAASMAGFPAWIRIAVGIVEVAGAVALLVPGVATLGAVSLALLMIPAFATQLMSHQPGSWIPVVVGAVLVALIWRRNPDDFDRAWGALARSPHPVLREGAAMGAIGATCIAVWFFLVDLVAGRPLFTPALLGHGLFSVLGPGLGESRGVDVLIYTLFHYAVFIGVGFVASLIVRAAGREPSLLLGFVMLFVAFEIAFYALVALLQQSTPLGGLAWYNVMAGNVIAAAGMWVYLWKAHPAVREQFHHAFDPAT